MTGRRTALWLVMGLLVVIGVAFATGTLDEFLPGFSGGGTIQVVHDWDLPDGTPGPRTTLRVHRSADQPGNMITLGFTLEIEAIGVLTSASLQTGTDSNGNGHLEANEWTTISAATISEANGKTLAVGPSVSVASNYDAYRVVSDRTDIGRSEDVWGNNPAIDIPMPFSD